MKGKFKRTVLVLVAMVIGLIGFAAIGCGGDDTPEPQPEPPSPVTYYGELSGTEYKLVVVGADFTLTAGGTERTGSIEISDSGVTLSFPDGSSLSGVKAGTVITITYDGTQLKLYEDINYTVKFDSAGGSSVSSQTVRNGKTVSKPSNPTRDKYSFVDWYTSAAYTETYNFSNVITGDTTLYARWLPIPNDVEYTVNFDLNYAGAAKLDSKQTMGGMIVDAPTPTRAGYDFKGWWVSMTGEVDNGVPELAYKLKDTTVLEEDTTVYAVWQAPAAAGDRLPAPMVDVNEKGISWQSVGMTANGYAITITGPNDYNKDRNEPSTSWAIDFASLPAGDYTITVVARSSAGQDKYSEPTVRVYRNKALARVSKFNVKEEVLLEYNSVKNATNYKVYVDCDIASHSHNPYDNGSSTAYNFAKCGMREEGLNFYVEAEADGFATSRSAVFTYDRRLGAVVESSMSYAEATETISWAPVEKATGYIVKIGDVEKRVTGTSVDIREQGEGSVKVAVRPIADNYNSPKAAEITVNKKTLATPGNIRIEGTIVKWNPVLNAGKYVVEIAGKTYEVTTNQIDLLTKNDISWVTGNKYSVTVKTVTGSKQSLKSEPVVAEYNSMSGGLSYDTNHVRWPFVFGAAKYDVRVNEGSIQTVAGLNNAKVTLTKEGDNKIQVRWYLVGSDTPSNWVDITVKAFALNYNLNGAECTLATQYYALGDEITTYVSSDIEIEKVGHRFIGWYTGDDENAALFEKVIYNTSGNTTIFAGWQAREYVVTLNYNEMGVGAASTAIVTYGQPFSIAPPTEIKEGTHGFIGWFRGTSANSVQYSDEYGDSLFAWNDPIGLTLYAQYRPVLSFLKQKDGTYWVAAGVARGVTRTITIPETYEGGKVTDLGSTAFDSALNLETLRIPASIEHINDATFQNVASLKAIEVYDVEGVHEPKYFSEDGVLFFNNETNQGGTIDVWAYPRSRAAEVYTVPNFVTSIPMNAFYYSQFKEVIIPTNVTFIGGAAFYKTNNLKTVTFLADNTFEAGVNGSSMQPLAIKAGAFCEAPYITKITLPARLSNMEDGNFNVGIFYNLHNLIEIEFDEASEYKIDENGMVYLPGSGSRKSKLVFCPNGYTGDQDNAVVLTDKVEVIGSNAFAGQRGLLTITIPATVTELEKSAFAGYRIFLEGTTLSRSDISGTWATKIIFAGNRLVGLKIGESAFGYTYTVDDNGIEDRDAFTACGRLEELVFEDGSNVTEIGNWAFAGCLKLNNVVIPNSVTRIGNNAFRQCNVLSSFGFEETGAGDEIDEDKILTTGNDVFYNCGSLKSLTLPYFFRFETDSDGNKVVNTGLFAGCDSLQIVEVDPRNPDFTSEGGVLFDKEKTAIYFYPSSKKGVYDLPETIETIGSGVFGGKQNLTGIIIHQNVTRIGERVFENCTNLLSVEFRGTWTKELTLVAGAFNGCSQLTTVNLPDMVKEIPDKLFQNCKTLVSVNIPSTVTYIGESAFDGCTMLKGTKKADGTWELVIPKTVTRLGYKAFQYCAALTNVVFEDGRTEDLDLLDSYGDAIQSVTTSSYAFFGCSSLQKVTLVEGITAIGYAMFQGCSSLAEITIPTTVKYIGGYSFNGCTSLARLTFTPRTGDTPTSLEIAGGGTASYSTFYGIKIKQLVLPNGLKRIHAYTFSGLKELQEVTIPNTVTNGTFVSYYASGGSYPSYLADYGEAIGAYAFSSCPELYSVTFLGGGTDPLALGPNAFYNGTKLQSIELPARLDAYTYNERKAVTNSSGHPTGAFNETGVVLTRHVINSAFDSQTGLSSVTVASGGKYAYYDGMIMEANSKGYTLLYCPRGKSGEVTIPYNVTHIGDYSFTGNKGITKITFQQTNPQNAQEAPLPLTIGDGEGYTGTTPNGTYSTGPFYSMPALEKVEFPARLTKINNYAFYSNLNQSALKEITFGDNCQITDIGYQAFYMCVKLQTIDFGANSKLTTIGEKAFERCSSLTSVTLPTNVTEIKNSAFSGTTKLATFTIPSDTDENGNPVADKSKLNKIGNNAFEKSGVKKIYIPNSFASNGFGNSVFFGCGSLTSISIPNTISSVDGLFSGCFKLSDITIRAVDANASITGSDGLMFTTDTSGKKTLAYCSLGFKGDLIEVEGERVPNPDGIVTIPDGVVAISDSAFAYNPYIKEVRIPTSVKSVGEKAFYMCRSLKKISFYNTEATAATDIEIKDYAFANNSELASVSLPANLLSIGDYAFQNTYSLKSVKDSNNQVINAVTFADGCNLRTIGKYAFYYSAIDLIDLPSKQLQKIDDYAFRYSGLKAITIPNSVTLLGSDPEQKATGSMRYASSFVFANCAALESVIFASGSGSVKIHQYVFDACTELKNVTLSSRVTNIGPYMFRGTAIVNITIPKEVKEIGAYAFQNCKSLDTVSFEANSQCVSFGHRNYLDASGTYASSSYFYAQCFKDSGLKQITIPASINLAVVSSICNLKPDNFTGTQLTKVTFESPETARTGVQQLYSSLFKDITTLTTVTLPNDLNTINASVFANTGLQSITIPGSVNNFGNTVFQNCADLEEVKFEEVTSSTYTWSAKTSATATADATVFRGCSSLKKVVLPKGIKFLGNNIFQNLKNLEEVELPSTLQQISNNAFYGSGIMEITVPASVTEIGNSAFRECANLYERDVEVTDEEGVTSTVKKGGIKFAAGTSNLTVGTDTFYNSGLTKIIIPARVTDLGAASFASCSSLTSVTFESNSKLKAIDYNMFWGTGIKTITLPDSVKSIGNYAFRASKLESITLSSEITSIDAKNPFAYCTELEELKVATANTKFCAENNILYSKDKTVVYAAALKGVTGALSLTDGVKEIKSWAFAMSPITSLEVGDEVKIGEEAFESSGIVNLTLGNKVEIGLYAFSDCASLNIVSIGDEVSMDSAAFVRSTLTRLTVGADADLGDQAFGNCAALATVEIGDNAAIGYQTFGNCDRLSSVTIGDDANIGTRAFENCDILTTVSASSVASMGADVFKDCFNNVTLSGADDVAMEYKGYELVYDEENEYWYLNINSDFGTTFRGDASIEHIVIGTGVTEIEADAFNGCSNLVTIVMEEDESVVTPSVDIGASAFANCTSLKKLVLPKRVRKIGDGILTGSLAIEEIVTPFVGNNRAISTSVVNTSGQRNYFAIWYGATSYSTAVSATIKKVTLTDSQYLISGAFNIPTIEYLSLPDTVVSIGGGLFNSNAANLKEIHLGENLTAIPNSFFSKCTALEEITIPLSVTTIGGTSAFTDTTALTKVYYEGTLDDWIKIAFANGKGGTPLCNGATLYIDGQPVSGEYTVPAGTTTINQYTFYNMKGITKITVPASVTNYGTFAFSMCPDLTTVIMGTPETEPTIGASLFQDSAALSSVTLPENLVTAGSNMFKNCTSLETITLPNTFNPRNANYITTTTNCTNMFQNTGIKSIVLPSSMEVVNNYMFADCAELTSVTIPDSVVTIGIYVFSNCPKLNNVVIPDSVVNTNNYTFQNCTGLSSIKLSAGMTKINQYFFNGCTALTSITIPEGITVIDSCAFQNTSLTSVTLPASLTELGATAFGYCADLAKVTFAEDGALNKFGNGVFRDCTALTSIVIPSTLNVLGTNCFAGWTEDQTIYMDGFGGPLLDWNLQWYDGSEATVVWDWVAPTTAPETTD